MGSKMYRAIFAMSEPTGGKALFAVEKRARHHKGVARTPIRLENVALKRAAAASPLLFAVNTVEERIVVGRTDRNRSPGEYSLESKDRR